MKGAGNGQRQSENVYLPLKGRIEEIRKQTADVSLFRIRAKAPLDYKPGQFFMVSVWGAGEVPISTASLCENDDLVELCIRRTGAVTAAIHSLRKDDFLWLRGPYGNGFPMERFAKGDVLLVAGGIGVVPLRPLVQQFMKGRGEDCRVTLFYGSKTPEEVIFRNEIEAWEREGMRVVLTVDRANKEWKGNIGFVTGLWHKAHIDFKEGASYICGPEVMIRTAMRDLSFFGMRDDRIITTLEAHMKCGIGKCGHCYSGPKYICTDGPIFSYKEIKEYALLG